MKRVLFILTFFATFISCKTPSDTLYGKCGKDYYACTQLLLKKNGEFEYFQFYDVGGSTIVKGRWQGRGDTIVLNSYEQNESRLDTVIETTYPGAKNKIQFEGSFWGFVTNDSARYNVDDGRTSIELDGGFRNISFHFYDEKGNVIPVPYKLKNPSTNQLLVRVRRLSTDLILTDLRLLKKRNKLKFMDQPWIKKRVSMQHKQW